MLFARFLVGIYTKSMQSGVEKTGTHEFCVNSSVETLVNLDTETYTVDL